MGARPAAAKGPGCTAGTPATAAGARGAGPLAAPEGADNPHLGFINVPPPLICVSP